MKQIFLLVMAAFPGLLLAQQKDNSDAVERIIITKKGDQHEKLNIVVDGEKVTLNGKPLTENEDAEVSVKRMKIKDLNSFSEDLPDHLMNNMQLHLKTAFPNKAMLGVTSEKVDGGAEVKNVTEESAADKAGLKEGDIITAVDAKKIETPQELSEALKNKNPGDKVSISYLRNGKKATVTAELTPWKAPGSIMLNGSPQLDINDIFRNYRQLQPGNNGIRQWQFRTFPDRALAGMHSGPKLGIKVQDVEKGTGVKVIEVEKGSDADKAGLKEGDIIKEANNVMLNSTDELLAQKRKTEPGSTFRLKVDRNGKSQQIEIHFNKTIKTAEL